MSNLCPDDRGQCRGVPVTTPARTLGDVSGAVPFVELGRAVDDALRRKLVALVALRACHQRLDTGPGRRATVAMRRVLDEREPGHDPGGSDRELWVKHVLVAAGLRSPVQQHRVRIGPYTYKLDFAYPPEMLGLEFDGWDTHRGFSAFHGDRERARILVAHGWSILQVTSRTRASDLVADVSVALARPGRLRSA